MIQSGGIPRHGQAQPRPFSKMIEFQPVTVSGVSFEWMPGLTKRHSVYLRAGVPARL